MGYSFKKEITITNAFQKIFKKSNHKPNKIWIDKCSQFCNRSMKSFLRNNNIDMYSMQNEGKYVVAERFIRTFKNKICRYMTSVSENVYIDKLDDIVNKHNNTYHSIIKTKPVDVKSKTYVDSSKEIIDENYNVILLSDISRLSANTFLNNFWAKSIIFEILLYYVW